MVKGKRGFKETRGERKALALKDAPLLFLYHANPRKDELLAAILVRVHKVWGNGPGMDRKERRIGADLEEKRLTSINAYYTFRETLPKALFLYPMIPVDCLQIRSYPARSPWSFDAAPKHP